MSFIHPSAEVQSQHIGKGTRVWQFAVILSEAVIGEECNINCHTFIENHVKLGNRVTVKSGVYLWDGITAEDDVFIGPNATFTNDPYPRSQHYPGQHIGATLKKACSIGANATILGGTTIGEYALIAAGAVVTKDVKAHALMVGNPARQTGWVDFQGQKMEKIREGHWKSVSGQLAEEKDGMLMFDTK
jgi:UDP-2-acetamido-3-amino-2,3-dideoxy-glucuronate N-acetyltransferase